MSCVGNITGVDVQSWAHFNFNLDKLLFSLKTLSQTSNTDTSGDEGFPPDREGIENATTN